MKNLFLVLLPIVSIFFPLWNNPAFAVEVAPRISDREIVESLTEVRGDIKGLRAEIQGDMKSLRAEIQGDIEGLRAEMQGDMKSLRAEIQGDIKGLRADMKGLEERLDTTDKGINKRIDDLRSEIGSRFDTLHWTLGIFITIALVNFGFVLRMQWQMHRRQTQTETILDTQRSELSFIKGLIEKLMPPRGVL